METVKFGFTAEQIINEGRITKKDIDLIKDWLSTQSFPKITDEQIVLFLLSCLNKEELTKTTIKTYYAVKKATPDLFDNRKLDRPDIQKQLITGEFSVLPERTDDGRAIIFCRLHDPNSSNFQMGPCVKILFMTLDAAIHNDPPTGLVILLDLKNLGLMHLTKLKIGYVKATFQYLQEGLPVRLTAIHILNTGYFVDKLMSIINPFIRKEVLAMLHFHSPSIDMNLFYETFLPKRCLPEDFGGDLPPVRELHQKNIEKLRDMESHFEAEQCQRYQY